MLTICSHSCVGALGVQLNLLCTPRPQHSKSLPQLAQPLKPACWSWSAFSVARSALRDLTSAVALFSASTRSRMLACRQQPADSNGPVCPVDSRACHGHQLVVQEPAGVAYRYRTLHIKHVCGCQQASGKGWGDAVRLSVAAYAHLCLLCCQNCFDDGLHSALR